MLKLTESQTALDYPWDKNGVISKNIERIMSNEVTSENLCVWDNEGKMFSIKSYEDVRKFFDSFQSKKDDPKVYEELETLAKSMERVCQLRFKAGRTEFEVKDSIFNKNATGLLKDESNGITGPLYLIKR